MKKGYLFIFITAFAFSTMEIVGKMVSTQLSPFQLTFIRFLIGGLFLLPFAIKELRKRQLKLQWKDYLFFGMTGVMGVVVSMSFFQMAILDAKASIVAVVFSTNSVFTIPLAWMILKERLEKKMLLALAISLAGLLLIMNPFSAKADFRGILFALLAAIAFSLFGVIGKTHIHQYGALILNSFSFLLGDGVLLIFLLLFQEPVFSGIQAANLLQILYLGIFVTGIGYLCYFEAMKQTSAITASMVFFIKPALAPLLSLLILRETLNSTTIAGIIFIAVGSLVSFLAKKREQGSLVKPGKA